MQCGILWTSNEPRDLDKHKHVLVYRRVRNTANGSETPTCAAVKQAGAGVFGEAVRLEARRVNYRGTPSPWFEILSRYGQKWVVDSLWSGMAIGG